jgi:hypothetical protein
VPIVGIVRLPPSQGVDYADCRDYADSGQGGVTTVETVALPETINCFGGVINYPRVVGAGGWPVVGVIPMVMFAPGAWGERGGGVKGVVGVVPITEINYGFCR